MSSTSAAKKRQYVPPRNVLNEAIASTLKEVGSQGAAPTSKQMSRILAKENPTWIFTERRISKLLNKQLKPSVVALQDVDSDDECSVSSTSSTASRARKAIRNISLKMTPKSKSKGLKDAEGSRSSFKRGIIKKVAFFRRESRSSRSSKSVIDSLPNGIDSTTSKTSLALPKEVKSERAPLDAKATNLLPSAHYSDSEKDDNDESDLLETVCVYTIFQDTKISNHFINSHQGTGTDSGTAATAESEDKSAASSSCSEVEVEIAADVANIYTDVSQSSTLCFGENVGAISENDATPADAVPTVPSSTSAARSEVKDLDIDSKTADMAISWVPPATNFTSNEDAILEYDAKSTDLATSATPNTSVTSRVDAFLECNAKHAETVISIFPITNATCKVYTGVQSDYKSLESAYFNLPSVNSIVGNNTISNNTMQEVDSGDARQEPSMPTDAYSDDNGDIDIILEGIKSGDAEKQPLVVFSKRDAYSDDNDGKKEGPCAGSDGCIIL